VIGGTADAWRAGRAGRDTESLPLAMEVWKLRMCHQQYAGPFWLFLLSPLFPTAGEQNAHPSLGKGNYALRARRYKLF
jgi:hypothetical protein